MRDRIKEAALLAGSIRESSCRAAALRQVVAALTQAKRYPEAIEFARSIGGVGSERDAALVEVAKALTESGNYNEGIELARTIKNWEYRNPTQRDVAHELANAGRFDEAIELARSISGDGSYRNWALTDVTHELADAGKFDDAIELARSVESDPQDQNASLVYVAKTLARAGKFGEAIELARSISGDGSYRNQSLRDVAYELAKAGRFDEAIRLARSISGDESCRNWALTDVTHELADAGKFDDAIELARSVELDPQDRNAPLVYVAKALTKAGKFGEAMEIARSIAGVGSDWNWDRQLLAELANAGRYDQVIDLAGSTEGDRSSKADAARRALVMALAYSKKYREAIEVASAIKEVGYRNQAIIEAVKAPAKEGNYKQAIELAGSIKGNQSDRNLALTSVVEVLAEAGKFAEALNLAHAIEGGSDRILALRQVAYALAQDGNFDEAIKIARSTKGDRSGNWVLSSIANVLARAGKFDEAMELANSIEGDEYQRYSAQRGVASALVEAGKLDKAIVLARSIGGGNRQRALRDAVNALAQAGKLKEAIVLARSVQGREAARAMTDAVNALAKAKRFEEAIELARCIEGDESDQNWSPTAAASALAQAGNYSEAIEFARSIEDAQSNASALFAVSCTQLMVGDYKRGLEAAAYVKDEATQALALNLTTNVLKAALQEDHHSARLLTHFALDRSFENDGDIARLQSVLPALTPHIAEYRTFAGPLKDRARLAATFFLLSASADESEIPAALEDIWSSERKILVTGHSLSGEPIASFKPETRYALRFRVAAKSVGNLASGDVDVTGVPGSGLKARWIVASASVEFLAVSDAGTIVKRGGTYLAEFDLAIPGQGESATVTLDVRTTKVIGELTLTLLVAGEEYRKLTVNLSVGAQVKEDVVCTAPGHLNLRTTHEWTKPPEHIEVNVFGQAARVTTIRGTNDYSTVEWMGTSTTLKNPIQRIRSALERFRIAAEDHLNNLDIADMKSHLQTSQWQCDFNWSNLKFAADSTHNDALTALACSTELRALANDGYSLFNTCFPKRSGLREIIEKLEPGSRLDFVWTSRGAVDWVSHVPWALMYLDPLKPFEPVNCERFLGLRYRIGSKSWEPNAPSRALGDPAEVNFLNFLYWGSDPADDVGVQSRWQRKEFGKWARQNFVPDPNRSDPKDQVVEALETPQPDPAATLYFYCHCSVGDGSNPVLQFGENARTVDIVEASDIYQGKLETGPLVFANACTTAAADPLGTSELESRFFARDIRAFLGTESNVPVILASRFAWLFFQFFLRKADPSPMAAGEALAQTRLFLWTQYRNPGGLFYCLVNQYDLYLASSEEVTQLQRR